jgi:CRISPR system Cascade subunit CasA
MPRAHQIDRAFWRGLEAVLPQTEATLFSDFEAPNILQWLGRLSEDEIISNQYLMNLRAVGVNYGSNNSVISGMMNDSLLIHTALLAPGNHKLRQQAINAVAVADKAVSTLVLLARNIEVASGNSEPQSLPAVRASAFYQLDQPFRMWLSSLTNHTELAEARANWETKVGDVLSNLSREMLDEASPTAFSGHEIKAKSGAAKGSPEWMTIGRASAIFYRQLAAALPDRAKRLRPSKSDNSPKDETV